MVLLACEGFSFYRVAILTNQGTCDYLNTSKAGVSKYDSRYEYNLECVSFTTKQYTTH